ncbi:hypothetical protein A2U01_0085073, partial [Trifolium medium]|nr:hypothetical protein [Trifolium medium]
TLSSTESDDLSSDLVICSYYDYHVVAGTLSSTVSDPISTGEKIGILFAGICSLRLLLSSTPRRLATACSVLACTVLDD